MFHAYKLYVEKDNQSHVIEGSIDTDFTSDVTTIHFQETPAHSSLDWHTAPIKQYVITLSGTLEFTIRDGKKFIIKPGDVLVAEDDIGTGHKWRLIDDQPWRRVYVVLRQGAKDAFIAK